MRKIKFRQYLDNGKWHYWGFVKIGWVGPMLFPSIEYAAKHSQQYTGLTDKNGVDIFEGDIISLIRCPERHFSCMCEKKPDPSFTGQVIFKNGSFICAEVENSISEYVVIGNIYENPPTTGEVRNLDEI